MALRASDISPVACDFNKNDVERFGAETAPNDGGIPALKL